MANTKITNHIVDSTVITGQTAVTAADGDYILVADASDSNALKKVLASDLIQSSEEISDIVGAMVSSNTESGITVAYQDSDNTLDFTIGTLNQNTTGTADNITVSANNSTDETVYPIFVDGNTGSQGAETDTGLTYNPSTGMLTTTGVTATFTGNITGNVTGNTSGTAATVTGAAQTNITSLGTLTSLGVDGAATFNESGADANFRIESDGLEYMFFVDAGNNRVAINHDAPSGIFHVAGHTSSIASIFESNGGGDTVPLQLKVKANNNATSLEGLEGEAGSTSSDNGLGILGTNYIRFKTGATERMRIDSSGKLAITKNIAGALQATVLELWSINAQDQTDNQTTDLDFFLVDSNTNTGTPNARIGATGDATGDQNHEAGGRLSFYVTTQSVSSPVLTKRGEFNAEEGGDFYTNDGSVSSLSDVRVKTNINNLTDGLNIVTQLRPVTYEYNNTTSGDIPGLGEKDGITRYGLIADEVKTVAPHYVKEGSGHVNGSLVNDFKSLSLQRMIPMLIKSIQELKTENDALKARITTLEG